MGFVGDIFSGVTKTIGSALGIGGDAGEKSAGQLSAQADNLFKAGAAVRRPVVDLLTKFLDSGDLPDIFAKHVARGPTILSPAIQNLATGENQAIQAIINRTPTRGGQLNQQISQTIRDRLFQQLLLSTQLKESERRDRLGLAQSLFGQAANVGFGAGTTSAPLQGLANAGQLFDAFQNRQVAIGQSNLQGLGSLAGKAFSGGFGGGSPGISPGTTSGTFGGF